MRTEVRLVEKLNNDLVALWWGGSTRSPRQTLWTTAKLRKPKRCAVTGRMMEVGELAFRPIGNVDYRGVRIDCMVLAATIGTEEEE